MRECRVRVREETKNVRMSGGKTEAYECCSLKLLVSDHLKMFLCSPFGPFQSLTQAEVLQNDKNQTSGMAGVF